MAEIYNSSGEKVGTLTDNHVFIKDIKAEYPSYNDDQLLEIAIASAKNLGSTSSIVWDGDDIHFSGDVSHECFGFCGIDFNGSQIIMPNYDGGIIIKIKPDESTDLNGVSASDFYDTYTTNNALKNKLFSIDSENPDLCIGDRHGFQTVSYYSPMLMTMPNGKYTSGRLYLTPETGTVNCRNVHDYPAVTFDIKNATVVSYNSANMSTLIECTRSNVRLHNFVLNGKSLVNEYHNGIFVFRRCCNIEIDHITGINPIIETLTSGYFVLLQQILKLYMHDINVGDNDSWGAMGGGHLTDTVVERCYLNRWDCHYAQYGNHAIRNCSLNAVNYGVGYGAIVIENCLLTGKNTGSKSIINLREDITGVFDGNIVAKDCIIQKGEISGNNFVIWDDSCEYAKPSNSKLSGAPNKGRFLIRCDIPSTADAIFKIGSETVADQPMFENLVYAVKDMKTSVTKIIALGSGSISEDTSVVDYYGKVSY